MRDDDIGMFWQDYPQRKAADRIAPVMPEIPVTGWKRPRDFPNLAQAPWISIDTETYDPDLLEIGPAWATTPAQRSFYLGNGSTLAGTGVDDSTWVTTSPRVTPPHGCVVGFSVAVPGHAWYFPIRHAVQPEDNIDPAHALAWLRDTLANPAQPKFGANLMYDLGWLAEEGVTVRGELYDAQFAEALLSEVDSVGLEEMAQKYLGAGKESNLLYQWCCEYYGGEPTPKQRKNIWRAPPSLVGAYAESDAYLPEQVMQAQYKHLQDQGLWELFRMECALIPLLIAMRQQGVRVSRTRANEVDDHLTQRIDQLQSQLDTTGGREIVVTQPASLAALFE